METINNNCRHRAHEQSTEITGIHLWNIICEDAIAYIRGLAGPCAWYMLLATCRAFEEPRTRVLKELILPINIVSDAAHLGSVSLLKYGIELGHPVTKNTLPDVIYSGNMECARALPACVFYRSPRAALMAVAATGSLELYEFIETNMYLKNRNKGYLHCAYYEAARNNRINILRRLVIDAPLPDDLAETAADAHHSDAIIWAIQNGAQITQRVYHGIALGWKSSTIPRTEIVTLFKWVHGVAIKRDGCSLPDGSTLAIAVGLNISELIDWFKQYRPHVIIDGALVCAKYGWINIIEQSRISDPAAVIITAVTNGQIGVLEWLRDKGTVFPPKLSEIAARNGDLKMLNWLYEFYGRDEYQYEAHIAVERGHLNILQFLADRGHHPFEYSSQTAAEAANIVIMAWLRDNDCFDVDHALLGAIEADNAKTAAWIEPDPNMWSDNVYKYIVKHNATSIRKMVDNHGCSSRVNVAVHSAFSRFGLCSGTY